MHNQTPRIRRILLSAGIVLVALALSTIPAIAHHGWGGYEDSQTDLTGTVETAVSLSGPHATMRIRANGQLWNVVLAPPARTEAAGLKEGIIPLGAQVKVSGHRHRDPKKFELKTERVTWNGKLFNVYPDRS